MGRKTTLFEIVARLPWITGVVLAAIVYIAQKIYLANAPQGIAGQILTTPVKYITYILIALFLAAALVSLINQIRRAKRYDKTRSLDDIRSLTWRQFESFTAEAYKRKGYAVIETPEGPDNGIDLVLRKDGEKTYVQCKHWKTNSVGVEKIRELLGSMAAGVAQNGIFVTSGMYTKPARDFARECGIRLVDGEGLVVLIGGMTEKRNSIPSKQKATVEMTCPECNAPMVKRIAQRGSNRGNSFMGCSKYPECSGMRQL
jgi:restriction system protein